MCGTNRRPHIGQNTCITFLNRERERGPYHTVRLIDQYLNSLCGDSANSHTSRMNTVFSFRLTKEIKKFGIEFDFWADLILNESQLFIWSHEQNNNNWKKKRTRKIEMYRMSSHIVENSILIVFRFFIAFFIQFDSRWTCHEAVKWLWRPIELYIHINWTHNNHIRV